MARKILPPMIGIVAFAAALVTVQTRHRQSQVDGTGVVRRRLD